MAKLYAANDLLRNAHKKASWHDERTSLPTKGRSEEDGNLRPLLLLSPHAPKHGDRRPQARAFRCAHAPGHSRFSRLLHESEYTA